MNAAVIEKPNSNYLPPTLFGTLLVQFVDELETNLYASACFMVILNKVLELCRSLSFV